MKRSISNIQQGTPNVQVVREEFVRIPTTSLEVGHSVLDIGY
jgi:hypothetical protein